MRAVVFDQAGEPLNVLRLAETATPKIGEGEVLVKVTARPIHPADRSFIRGQYRVRPAFPQTAGLEGAGVVVEASRGAAIAAGARVAFRWPGTWAEFAVAPAARLIEVPADISDELASQAALNPVTAWGLLDQAKPVAGDWLLLTAAASVVSNLAATMARKRGIRVMGIVRGDAAEGAARSGAEHVFSASDPALTEKIVATAGERRVAAVLDSVGGPLLSKLFATLAPGARIIAYGVQDREPAAVANATLIYSNLTWKGFGVDRFLSGLSAPSAAAMWQALWSMIRSGALALPVDSTHELARFADALAADDRPGRRGKVLLV
ncbi:MAG TPA: zinc-dependent alcohol dehydrogenase family protein [Beijerinckiaceae bacterium]|nr:zinc-dependent alcohol dehydrogenase family protein [Beijerinckiaceae bacterium]